MNKKEKPRGRSASIDRLLKTAAVVMQERLARGHIAEYGVHIEWWLEDYAALTQPACEEWPGR